jgi:hypothetical protein
VAVEEVPAVTLSGDPHETSMDTEVAKIVSENLATSEVQTIDETSLA